MMGYHNCPPHPLEPLDEELDSYWLEKAKREAKEGMKRFKEKMRQMTWQQPFRGGVRFK